MAKQNSRRVIQGDDGRWRNKKDRNSRASSTHSTQAEAAREAKRQLQNEGGGELLIHGRDGKIRSKDTIPPGNDPNPPKDKEH